MMIISSGQVNADFVTLVNKSGLTSDHILVETE